MTNTIFTVPLDCWCEITRYVNALDVMRITQTCHTLYDVLSDDSIWRRFCLFHHLMYDRQSSESCMARTLRHLRLKRAEDRLLGRAGVKQDIAAACADIHQLAVAGDHRAMMICGVLLWHGCYVASNPAAAKAMLLPSQHPVARAMCYRWGLGVATDPDAAMECLMQAPDQEDYMLKCELGCLYSTMTRRRTLSADLLRESALEGYAHAQFLSGASEGLERAVARTWHVKAAAQGHSGSQQWLDRARH